MSWPAVVFRVPILLFRLLLLVGLPTATLAFEIAGLFYFVGPRALGTFLFVAGLVGLAALWVLTAWLDEVARPAVIASSVFVFAAWYGIAYAEENWVLDVRGETTTCTVLSEDSHLESSGDLSGWMYDYRLDCAAGHPDTIFGRFHPIADPGQQIEVSYDPLGATRPQYAGDVTDDYVGKLIAARVFYGIAVLIMLGAVIYTEAEWWDARSRRTLDATAPRA